MKKYPILLNSDKSILLKLKIFIFVDKTNFQKIFMWNKNEANGKKENNINA